MKASTRAARLGDAGSLIRKKSESPRRGGEEGWISEATAATPQAARQKSALAGNPLQVDG
jgi:hypothetical protein